MDAFNYSLKPFRAFFQRPHGLSSSFGSPYFRSLFFSSRPLFWFLRRRYSCCKSFMEVVRAVAEEGSSGSGSIAIRAEQKNYSYKSLISSAQKISYILLNANLNTTERCGSGEYPLVANGDKGSKHIGGGSRIGIVAKPSPDFVAGILGTWIGGGVAVPLATSYPEAELLHVAKDSDVSMILTTEEHYEMMRNVAASVDAEISLIPPVASMSSGENPSDHLGNFEIIHDKEYEDYPALIIYTSGTTGKPKGVVHTHKGITAQVQMLSENWGYTAADKFLHCLPLHHVHGLFNSLLAPLYAGSMVEFMSKFSVSGIWNRWRESYPRDGSTLDGAITVFTGVPTMYTRLIQGYEAMESEIQIASATAASKLRLMMCGSSALPLPIMQQWEAITGHRLLERYGMTEFIMAISNPLDGRRKGGTVGNPFPGVETKIIPEDKDNKEMDGIGELCIRSPSLFKEYWKLPEVTMESFTEDGFFKTGDTVKADEDGYYIILGRTSADIMKIGGYKLSALDIEATLLEHRAISECCVLGLPDKDYGEVVCAIVVPDSDVRKERERDLMPAITLQELCSWAKDKLAPYKLPTRLLLWDSLPRNAMGKVNKKELKKKLMVEDK